MKKKESCSRKNPLRIFPERLFFLQISMHVYYWPFWRHSNYQYLLVKSSLSLLAIYALRIYLIYDLYLSTLLLIFLITFNNNVNLEIIIKKIHCTGRSDSSRIHNKHYINYQGYLLKCIHSVWFNMLPRLSINMHTLSLNFNYIATNIISKLPSNYDKNST